jgi:hypothetical protein
MAHLTALSNVPVTFTLAHMRLFIIFLLFAVLPMSTIADSINFGIASRCDSRNALFELVGVVEANDRFIYATSSTDGFERLEKGTQLLSCMINGKHCQCDDSSIFR